jgi:hypothetical protein
VFSDFSDVNICEFARNKGRIMQRSEMKVMKEGCRNKG